MAQRRTGRTIVAEPLTPALLARLGALEEVPETPADFRPSGAWVNKYLIFTCHGYVESGNQGVGVLRLERSPAESGSGFVFKVRQRIVHDAGHVHEIEALVRCRGDRLATPVQWRLLNRFEDIDGRELPELRSEQQGAFDGGELVIDNGGRQIRPAGATVTSDWGLMEAVQRLEAQAGLPGGFLMLQGFTVLRAAQRFTAVRRERVSELAGRPLLRLTQTGRGVLPYDYWLLPEERRLAVVTTGPRAYVLNDRAEEMLEQRLKDVRARIRRRRRG